VVVALPGETHEGARKLVQRNQRWVVE
jgi:hypothetical protein